MTEKRFYYFGSGEDINSGVIDGDTELTLEETVEIMNDLYEEKEMWKRECERLKGLYYLENEKIERYEYLAWKRVD